MPATENKELASENGASLPKRSRAVITLRVLLVNEGAPAHTKSPAVVMAHCPSGATRAVGIFHWLRGVASSNFAGRKASRSQQDQPAAPRMHVGCTCRSPAVPEAPWWAARTSRAGCETGRARVVKTTSTAAPRLESAPQHETPPERSTTQAWLPPTSRST